MNSKNFTYLKKNEPTFPHTDNGDVWETESSFDYHVWDVNTQVTVLHASWDRQYRNVVDFSDRDKRNDWFDSKKNDKNTFVLTSMSTILPDGTIRLPIPYDVLMRYNYIWVELPKLPVPYEDDGDRKYGFFIDSVRQVAPNTTECNVSLDYWTSFIDSTSINYMMLARGHAPMAKAPKPAEYLTEPLDKSDLLLAPDVDVEDGNNTRYSSNIARHIDSWQLFDGDTWVMLACTATLGTMDTWGDADNPIYRRLPAIRVETMSGFNTYGYVAIDSSDFKSFMDDIVKNIPWFYDQIVSAFYVPKKLVNVFGEYNAFGHTVYWVDNIRDTESLMRGLQVSDFGYPGEYSQITKLYTSPYSHIEIYDDDGDTTSIKIESMSSGSLRLMTALSIVGSIVTADCAILDVNGKTHLEEFGYNTKLTELANDGGYLLLKSWDIPTFVLVQDATDRTSYDRAIKNRQAQQNIDRTWQNGKDRLDTSYGNSNRSIDSSYTNSRNSLDTSQSNKNSTLDKNRELQLRGVGINRQNTASQVAYNTNQNNLGKQYLTAEYLQQRAYSRTQTWFNTVTAGDQAILSMASGSFAATQNTVGGIMGVVTGIGIAAITGEPWLASVATPVATQATNAAMSVLSDGGALGPSASAPQIHDATGWLEDSTVNIGGNGANPSYAALASIPSMIGSMTSNLNAATSNKTTAQIVAQRNVDIDCLEYGYWRGEMATSFPFGGESGGATITPNATPVNIDAPSTVWNNSDGLPSSIAGLRGRHSEVSNHEMGLYITKHKNDDYINLQNGLINEITGRTYGNEENNINDVYNLNKSITGNTYRTGYANLDRSRDANKTNNTNSYNTSLAILNRNKNVDTDNNITLATRDDQAQAPIVHGKDTNVARATSVPKGLQVSLVTRSKYATRMIGDQMLRWGYALNQQWSIDDGWQVMKHYTYWEATDLWLSCDRAGIEDAGEQLETILRNGTTVWSNPDEIGRVSIYDNWKDE